MNRKMRVTEKWGTVTAAKEKGDSGTNENRYPDCTGSEHAAH